MSINSELTKRLQRTLNERAQHHPEQADLLARVRFATAPRPIVWRHYAAMAAMLVVVVVMPAPLTPSVPDPLANTNPMLSSPQSVEDLEMLHMLDASVLEAS